MSYQPILMGPEEAKLLAKELGKPSLMGQAIAHEQQETDDYISKIGIEVPGHGEAGGYEHNRHKQNYIHMDMAGRLFLITGDVRYRDYIVELLSEYARVYPTLESNVSRDTNPPGRLFHQTLNENMFMLYASCAYSCVFNTMDAKTRAPIENDLFREMIKMFTVTYAHDFDIIHNHGLWAVAAVGICGYAIQDQASVDKALYGLKGDSKSGGFLAQLDQLFSPDGYYMEGPYYHRFSLRPIYLFAEAISRRQPQLDIYHHNNSVIKTTSYAVMSTAFPNGTLPALNDSSKTISIRDEGIIMATSVCFHTYEQTDTLLGMANKQQNVWVHISGLSLSKALEKTPNIKPFSWGSVFLSDGPLGDKGGVSILRHRDKDDDDTMALMWFGQHGSDHQFHSALDHGHFDGLHLSIFNRGHEVLPDYGFGRWVNIEPKFGGRYIPQNKSYCKQTIAHNTVTVDERTQNNSDTATAEKKFGQKHFFAAKDHSLQGMSATICDYYPGVKMQRSVLVAEVAGFEKPLILDIYRILSEKEHQYDLPVHHLGQIMCTNFDYTNASTLCALGQDHGYQHLWKVAEGKIEKGSSVTWLHDNSYYTMSTSGCAGAEVIFAQIGANDPDFNLRSEPVFIHRQKGANHVFASVLETHGYFNESTEESVSARGQVKVVEVVQDDDCATVVRLVTDDATHLFAVSNKANVSEDTAHSLVIDGVKYEWKGAFSQLK